MSKEVPEWSSRLRDLVGELPPEYQEEETTGRDLIDAIIQEAHDIGYACGPHVKENYEHQDLGSISRSAE